MTKVGIRIGLPPLKMKDWVKIAKTTFRKWQKNNATLRAASLTFFTILSLPSLLLALLGIFTLVYGQAQALEQLSRQITFVAGPTVAFIVGELLSSNANSLTSSVGSTLSLVFAIAGVIAAFMVLQDSVNGIWEIKPERHPTIKSKIQNRIVPFVAVSLSAIAVVSWTGLTNILFVSVGNLFGTATSLVLAAIQIVLSFVLTGLLFAIIYKLLPDTFVAWKDVVLASVLTGAVSTLMDYLFGFYIRAFPPSSLSGTAGAILILMLWIFVTFEIILFGAQFSKVYAEKAGSRSRFEGRLVVNH